MPTSGRSTPTRRRSEVFALVLVVVAATFTAPASAAVYWANYSDGGIWLIDPPHAQRQLSQAHSPCGIAVGSRYAYWAVGPDFTIGRASLDGTEVRHDFVTGATYPCGVALTATHIYWTNGGGAGPGGTTIGRANLDGSGANQSFITGLNGPCALATNATHLYWADCGPGGPRSTGTTIGRANLDGTAVNDAFITGASSPAGVALSSTHVYWSNSNTGTIGRATLAGASADQSFIVASPAPGQGAPSVTGLAVHDGFVFWDVYRDLLPATIGRANLDGTGVNQSFITTAGTRWVRGVAVDDRVTSTTSVTVAPPSGPFGTDQTLTAKVAPAAGGASPSPTGTVQFTYFDEPLGDPVQLNVQGEASIVPEFWFDVGDEVGASYSGDAAYLPSSAPSVNVNITAAETATELTLAPNPVITGNEVDALVNVSNLSTDALVFGEVQFTVDDTPIGFPLELDEDAQVAATLVANVPPGDYEVTAHFSDPFFEDFQASSGTATSTVTAATPLSPSSSAPPISPGATVQKVQKRDLVNMTSGLAAALKARGFRALRGAVQTFSAPSAGTLTQSISANVRGRNALAAAQRVISSGRHVFRTPSTAKLRLKLTALGRRTVKRAERLKLTVLTRFAPTTGSAVQSTRKLTVRRKAAATRLSMGG